MGDIAVETRRGQEDLHNENLRIPGGHLKLPLGAFAGAPGFYLWVYALERTTPTRVANTITVSPIAAALLATVLVGEPIGISLLIGIAAVGGGIWIASTERAEPI